MTTNRMTSAMSQLLCCLCLLIVASTVADSGEAHFGMTRNVTMFNPRPTMEEMHEIVSGIRDADLDAPYTISTFGSPEQLKAAVDFVEEKHAGREQIIDFNIPANPEDVLQWLGLEDLKKLLMMFWRHMGKRHYPVYRAIYQRFRHENDTVSPYHTDGTAISLVILLNDDFKGGEMTYLTRNGPVVVEQKAGATTIHGAGMVHGNAAVDGVKHQFTLIAREREGGQCMFQRLLGDEYVKIGEPSATDQEL